MVLKLITVATHDAGYFEHLKESCERLGYDLVVLGWGMEYTGHHMKTDLTIEYLQTCGPDDIVCFVDGFDSLALRGPDALVRTFLSMGVRLVFSDDVNVTTNPYIDETLGGLVGMINRKLCKTKSGVGILNSGMFIGFAEDLTKVFLDSLAVAERMPKLKKSNQRMLQEVCRKNPFPIDTRRLLFYNRDVNNFHKREKLNADGLTLNIDDVRTRPCFVSAPGGNTLKDILEGLGYDHSDPKNPVGDHDSVLGGPRIPGLMVKLSRYWHLLAAAALVLLWLLVKCLREKRLRR